MIPKKVIVDLALSLKLGEERSYNHPGCKAGEDTKHRLYIKRVVGGRLAYCHHCNEHGFARDLSTDGTALRAWLFGKTDDHPVVTRNSSPIDSYPITEPKLVEWLHGYFISMAESSSSTVFRQTKAKELVLYIQALGSGTRQGYQIRSFKPGKAKYTTHYYSSMGEACWFGGTGIKAVVVVEDILSAYRVHRDTGLGSVALLKTSLTKETTNLLVSLPITKILVWLDPDEAGQKGSRRIAERLKFITSGVEIIEIHEEEPKHQSVLRLKEILLGL